MWQIDLQDWTRVTKHMASFYLSQAETALKATMEQHDKITNRAFTLLTIHIPIVTVIIGYLLNSPPKSNATLAIVGIALCAAFSCLYLLTRLIFPRKYAPSGREPKEILIATMVENDLTPELKYVSILLAEIEMIQQKITINDSSNTQRIRLLEWVMLIMGVSFAFITLLLLIFHLFS